MRYSMKELEEMSVDELRKIAQEKIKNGNASQLAQKAQLIIWSRSFSFYKKEIDADIYEYDDIYD